MFLLIQDLGQDKVTVILVIYCLALLVLVMPHQFPEGLLQYMLMVDKLEELVIQLVHRLQLVPLMSLLEVE
jgi:hypothetical protein